MDIHQAAKYGDDARVKILCQNNAQNVEMKTNQFQTPLHIAAMYGHLKVIHCLIDLKADTQAVDVNHRTLLHLAVAYGRRDVVEFLLEETVKANIKARDIDGLSPLHMAVYFGQSEMETLLKKYGADPNAKDNSRRTPEKLRRYAIKLPT